ncbi:flagellar hook-associated protein FlgK [Nitrospina watsonii]|uniref:Flagellar hook-associated protein 1 n=1 Tax=Nitrospina watsonii TaxID=1323948 RepID=A0ABM9HAI5_9BACT|nr:flagellar hook-associated protein FlgK [Nitrospina watsonii]CAI2717139.1 Flagellar hook-associated protein flgK [Nitrospina watsonii]
MTTNIFSILNTAKLGLQSQQLAIEVTGNNVANVQTEGYSRQTVTLEPNTPRTFGLGQIGTGVRATGIARSFDQFLFNQILGENQSLGNFSIRRDVFENLEILLNESEGLSLNNELNHFFGALSDLANNPTGFSERTNAIAAGASLSQTFNKLGNALTEERLNLDRKVDDEVTQINSLLTEIVRLNESIPSSNLTGFSANDLSDQRDQLVKELSKKLDATLISSGDGKINLTLADGTPLVLGDQAFTLSTQGSSNNGGLKDIFIQDPSGTPVNITNTIQGGEMRGLLDMRDTEVANALDKLDRLAASIVTEINRVHQEGLGLDGTTGNDFFTALPVTIAADSANSGGSDITIINASATTTSTDKFRLNFTAANQFEVINRTTGQNVTGSPVTFTVGTPVNVDGFAITINTAPSGAGDVFDFSTSAGAASSLSVSTTLLADSQKLAAGLNSTGDGDNALALAGLQTRGVFSGLGFASGSGSATFDDFYSGLINSVGNGARSAQTLAQQQESISLQLDIRRESVSGVSIDEEMINLIKFQQAFQASARMISIVDEMFDILQNQI